MTDRAARNESSGRGRQMRCALKDRCRASGPPRGRPPTRANALRTRVLYSQPEVAERRGAGSPTSSCIAAEGTPTSLKLICETPRSHTIHQTVRVRTVRSLRVSMKINPSVLRGSGDGRDQANVGNLT
jgi:hypothetical protein